MGVTVAAGAKTDLGHYRVVIWADDVRAPVDAEVSDRIAEIGAVLAGLGATVSDSARPELDVDDALVTYKYLLHGAMSRRLSESKQAFYSEVA